MLLLTKYWIAPRAQRFLRWDEDGMSISARYLATARQNALVELDDELALLHGKFRVGGDIGDLLAAGKAARGDRVEREYLGRSGPGFTDADAEQNGKAGKVALAEHF